MRGVAAPPVRGPTVETTFIDYEVDGATFGVNIIPHTAKVTTWGDIKEGDKVNIEIDMLARYLARLKEFA